MGTGVRTQNAHYVADKAVLRRELGAEAKLGFLLLP